MKHRSSIALSTLCALGLGASLLAACGGRYQVLREVEDDPASGGSSSGGTSSTGGSAPLRAGWSSGGSSSAGSGNAGSSNVGAAGSSNCMNVRCALPKCLAGATPVTQPGQ